jgi:nucleotide-binding universal stress UspA family protein
MSGDKREKVVLCVSDNDKLTQPLLDLAGGELLKGKEVHLLHIFKQEVYAYEFSPFVWPDDKIFEELKLNLQSRLDNLLDKIVPDENERKVAKAKIYLHSSPKQKIVDYLTEHDADMVVVVTRGKHGFAGLFTSSTAEHLMKFSPCHVLILRDEMKSFKESK